MKYQPRRRLKPHLTPTEHAYIHVVSRIVDRRFIFGPEEKAQFLFFVRRYEAFCKVQIVGFCLMDNHFHLLVKLPGRPESRPSLLALLEHVKTTLGTTSAEVYKERIEFWEQQMVIGAARLAHPEKAAESPRSSGNAEKPSPMDMFLEEETDLVSYAAAQIEKVAQDIWQRMYDVSQFIFSVKLQFSHWFNKKSERVGTLWEERFRSTLIQPGPAVAEVAAYMDLNPVRAGLVQEAKDYLWSQFGAAAAGDTMALRGLACLAEMMAVRQTSPTTEHFRVDAPLRTMQLALILMELLLQRRGPAAGPSRQPKAETWELWDPLPSANYLRGPIRSFSRGVAIGDEAFLDKVFWENRDQFGPSRSRAARPLRLGDDSALIKPAANFRLKALRDTKPF